MRKLVAFFASLALTAMAVTPSSAANTTTRAFNSTNKYNEIIKGNLTVLGTVTAGNPGFSVGGSVATTENALKSKSVNYDIGPGTAAGLASSTVYECSIPLGRAATVVNITVSAMTAPVGGTNTVAVLKNNTATMLSANLDPTTLVANTGKILTLTGTTANLQLAPTDTVTVIWTAGAQTTPAVAPSVTIEYAPSADY